MAREDALSRERIVEAAIALLDQEGENGLTFRALAARLETGAGAIYWHVANKDELLAAATEVVVEATMGAARAGATPAAAIRAVAIGVFDTIEAHPWVGAQLSRAPWRTPMFRIYERLGQQVQALGVRKSAQFTAASTLLSYILGVSMQNAAQSDFARRELDPSLDRAAYLETVAAQWKQLAAAEYPFMRHAATQLTKHDDRAEYLAGIDLVLAGITASLA